MRRMHTLVILFLIAATLFSACNLGVVPPATNPPDLNQPPAVTESPALTEVPIQPIETQTLVPVPVDLSGPAMELGSKFLYVDGSILVAVPGGQFIMGHGGDNNPEHIVNVSDFWLYRAKVTNSQYAYCVAKGECPPPNPDQNPDFGNPLKANHPVVGVNHGQASAYCSFVHGRLPTEAEWEKAARGPDGNIYPWGDSTPVCDLANFGTCTFETTSVVEHPAGQSYYEALDMAGNTYEWVADWYDANYYVNSPTDDPLGPDLAFRRSVRSNGFNSPAYESESARRLSLAPIKTRNDLGFRCVVEDPTYFAPTCQSALVYGQDATTGLPVGGDYSESCPAVNIQQNSYCSGLVPVTNVEFSGPAGSIIDSDGCAPSADPELFVCQNPGTVSIQADCQQNFPPDPTCPPGYTQEGNTCKTNGAQGECLPGFNFDPASQCCAASPGDEASFDLPQCPVGTYYLDSQQACVPYPAQGVVSVVESINFIGCIPDPTKTPGSEGGDGGDDGGVCQAPPFGCTSTVASFFWCQSLCACVVRGTVCP